MISPSPIESHIDIARAFGSRTSLLDDAVRRSRQRRWRRRKAAALGDIQAAITIRPAGAADAHAIARLAVLDGHPLPGGEQLVAEADGRILAAVDVLSGATVADPFKPTASVAQLVALRAQQLRPQAA